jgi:hypothetical protein
VRLWQNIRQEWAGRAPAGEARNLAQDVQHRIADDARARLSPASSGVGQNLAAAAILLRAMSEPSTTEGRCIQGELRNLLEDAAVRRAESSASQRQGYPPEHRAVTSRLMREASVHTGRTRNSAPVAPGCLGNEHRRDRRAHLDEKVHRGYHPRRGGRYDSGEDQSPLLEPPGPRAFSRAIRQAPFPTQFRTPTTITKYHQIRMKESDQLATSFITPFGMYCYVTMPFGLRNAGATYQRCMNHVFGEHIGRTVEAYVDDIVVKTRKASDLLSDLETTFKCLKAKGVKLNPEKCVFGVPRGMLLGFIVSERGIEANPEKIAAITNMGPIKDLKGVQRVMGCLAALSRFISRLGERGLPLYRLLRKTERFTWTPEAEEALGNLKALLTSVPILVPPAAGEALLIYVAATTQVVSATIVVERREEGHALPVQRPVYFISEKLSETKIRYP